MSNLLALRRISNIGQPLVSPDGSVLAGYAVEFLLVNASGRAAAPFDLISGQRVLGSRVATTNAAGEFSVDLWPNSRGSEATRYLCQASGMTPFYASLAEGNTSLSWLDFKLAGQILTPQQITQLDAHIGNAAVHLTPAEKTLLTQLSGTAAQSFTHIQTAPASQWIINHNLGFKPAVAIFDAGGNELGADVLNVSSNQTVVSFATPYAGFARLN